MRIFIGLFLLFIVSFSFGQVVVYNPGGLPVLYVSKENSAETVQRYKNAEMNLRKAYEAYEEGNLEKTKYFLDESEKTGVVSAAFYLLLGQYFFVKEEYRYAKRYWKRGFKKHGCWECGEKLVLIPTE